MSKNYIVSNQIRCTSCGGEPFSMHRHDFCYCECRKVAVDGGQDYLKRVGSCWEEMSITIDRDALTQIIGVVDMSVQTGRNPLGITLAVLRAIRDADVVPSLDSGFTNWVDRPKEPVLIDKRDEYIKTLELEVKRLQDCIDSIRDLT